MPVRDYSNYVKDVIKWNDIANKLKESYTVDDISNQKDRVYEELKEAQDAILSNNYVELKDAICDIFVTGVYLDYMINCVDDSFYRRYKKTTSTIYKESDLSALFEKIKIALDNNSYEKLAYYIFRMCESISCDIKSDIKLVLDNNDTKFLDNEQDAIDSYKKYDSVGEKVKIHFSEKYSKYVILRLSDNKVMKPHNFKTVVLSVTDSVSLK
jgi:hypothetical protein